MFIYSMVKFQFTTVNVNFIAFTETNKETRGTISHHTDVTVPMILLLLHHSEGIHIYVSTVVRKCVLTRSNEEVV